MVWRFLLSYVWRHLDFTFLIHGINATCWSKWLDTIAGLLYLQAINFWKILVMNDEHTERKYVLFFLLGWGSPVVVIAVFYVVTFNLYRYVYSLPYDTIYGDVNNNGDMWVQNCSMKALDYYYLLEIIQKWSYFIFLSSPDHKVLMVTSLCPLTVISCASTFSLQHLLWYCLLDFNPTLYKWSRSYWNGSSWFHK